MRSRRGFRVILHAEYRLLFMPQTFHRLVVQINAVHRHIRRQRIGINGKTMVLGGDLHPAGIQILDWLIASAMTKLEFKGFAPKSLAQNLVPQTNAEDRNTRIQKGFYLLHNVAKCGRIARPIGKKNPRRLILQGILRRGCGRQHLHGKTMLPQAAQAVSREAQAAVA